MPAFMGIRAGSHQFIRWTTAEVAHCQFKLMTSCRFTPAMRKDLEDTCIYQILSDFSLTGCRIEPQDDSVYLRRVGQYWIISTNSTTKCHYGEVPKSDQPAIVDNHEITLSPVALFTINESAPLICDAFSLPVLIIQSAPQLIWYQNQTIIPVKENIFDIHSLLHNSSKWGKTSLYPITYRSHNGLHP